MSTSTTIPEDPSERAHPPALPRFPSTNSRTHSSSPPAQRRSPSVGAGGRRTSNASLATAGTATAGGGGVLNRLRSAISPNRGLENDDNESDVLGSVMSRSQSRGRDAISTGRGGAGNALRSPSRNRTDIITGHEPILPGAERGRAARNPSEDRVHHTGRGGAGNTRSPSAGGRVDREREDRLEEQLVADRRGREEVAGVPFSTGRGGAGNIGGSRSRSRSRPANGHEHHFLHGHGTKDGGDLSKTTTSTTQTTAATARAPHAHVSGGRGGFGNIVPVEQMSAEERSRHEAEKAADAEILSKYRNGPKTGLTGSGRGGGGNIGVSVDHVPAEELANMSLEEKAARGAFAAQEAKHGKTHGHGGAGNYTAPAQAREVELLQAEEGVRGRGSEKEGPLKKVFRSLSRSKA